MATNKHNSSKNLCKIYILLTLLFCSKSESYVINSTEIASDDLVTENSTLIPTPSSSTQSSYDVTATHAWNTTTTTETSQVYFGESTLDIIEWHGYPIEIHNVTTRDGYILQVHRIPFGKNNSNDTGVKRPPVFLQHCLLCSSADWVINDPDKSLGFILADRGYDVWLGNSRGNTYSRGHVNFSTSSSEFWDFSWDEMAKYDIPACIDYILEETNSSRLSYIGFSMGTTVAWAMLSENSEYNEKINVLFGLGPVAFMGNLRGPLARFSGYAEEIKGISEFFGINEVFSGGLFLDILTSLLCNSLLPDVVSICDNMLLSYIGMDVNYTNKRLLTKILWHTPAGTSMKNMVHFMQLMESGRFQKFDYGSFGNLQHYKTRKPLSYDLLETKVPVALFWAENDWLAHPKDVEKLSQRLPNIILKKQVPDDTFSHVDFLWSDTAVDLVYEDILRLLANYNKQNKPKEEEISI